MSKRRGGLGSGLDALLPSAPAGTPSNNLSIREIAIGDVRPNRYQPRKTFDDQAIADLCASIKEHGVVQPLIVTRLPSGGYELIAGERRLRAAGMAGLVTVPVIIRESTPQEMLEIAIIENVQRADLNPIEEALAYQALKDEFQLSDEEIAVRMGRTSRVHITNTRRLLRLTEDAQSALRAGAISAGHGRTLLKVNEPDKQNILLQVMQSDTVTVREAEHLSDFSFASLAQAHDELNRLRGVSTSTTRPPAPKPKGEIVDPEPQNTTSADDRAVARELEQFVGTPVQIQRSPRDVRLTFVFHSPEKLQEFLEVFSK
ncbi:MAG: hypothetical protein RLY87_383 [Chloroflexota bacterium]